MPKKKITKPKKVTTTKPIKKVANTSTTPPKVVSAVEPRRRKIASAWSLTKYSANLLWDNKRLFIMITVTYGLLNLLLVRGFASTTNVGELKSQLSGVFTGNFGAIGSSLSIFVLLVGSAGNSNNQTAGAYQLFLALVVSLAVIWSLRQRMAGNIIRARDAFYKGMYPLIPFLLVLIIIGLQLIPLLIGSAIYSAVVTNGIAVHLIEKILWVIFFLICAGVSLYFLASSLFALYIVTLPDMTPLKSLRSARDLVRGRRLAVTRKIVFLPLVLVVVSAVIMLPIIIVLTVAAQWVFFLLTMLSLVVTHTYMYSLYRELLDE